MPDSANNVWVDSSFGTEHAGIKDTATTVSFSDANVVGEYSIPVIYQAGESDKYSFKDNTVEYLQYFTIISGIVQIPIFYFEQNNHILFDGVMPTIVSYNTGDSVINGVINNDIYYNTGFTATSGSFDEMVTFIAGSTYDEFYNSLVNVWLYPQLSGISDFTVRYTNFSGNLTTSGTPIPVTIVDRNYIISYFMGTMNANGTLNKIVDITFNGWVDHSISTDVYSTLHCVGSGHTVDVTVISGSVLSNYLDVYCSTLTTSGTVIDVFCSLLDFIGVNFDVDLIPGRVGYNKTDVFSTALDSKGIVCDIGLLSLKITNFSLSEGQYTNISNSIYVDIIDDVCPISISGTYFKVNDTIISGTLSPIIDGYRLIYSSVEDFEFLNGPTIFTVHAENECGKVLEEYFNLTFGYIVRYENSESIGIDYDYDKKVVVRVSAENMASCPEVSSVAYTLESAKLKNRELGACINGLFYASGFTNLSSSIYPKSTAYFYGKEFKIIVHAKDFAGNEMTPFELMYRIEDKPAD